MSFAPRITNYICICSLFGALIVFHSLACLIIYRYLTIVTTKKRFLARWKQSTYAIITKVTAANFFEHYKQSDMTVLSIFDPLFPLKMKPSQRGVSGLNHSLRVLALSVTPDTFYVDEE